MSGRLLLVTADDFGIGPETTRGILAAAERGVVTSTVLLVNSPFAAEAVRSWQDAGRPLELGWHPCLTLDFPVSPAGRVASLVDEGGRFLTLARFLKRILLGQLNRDEVQAELQAQLARFIDLVGRPPANVNAHHHVHVFRAVAEPLIQVLQQHKVRPYLRRVQESLRSLASVPGARLKRSFLTLLGRQAAHLQSAAALSGNETLLGITDPKYVADAQFFTRWLNVSRGEHLELACHPGYDDPRLVGRDTDPHERRRHELERLLDPSFLATVKELGFRLVSAAEMMESTRSAVPVAPCQRARLALQRRRQPIPPN